MKNIELKLKSSETKITLDLALGMIVRVLNAPMEYRTLDVGTVNLKTLGKALVEKYDATIRDGITGGCYGARDGNDSMKGITAWFSPEHLVDRCVVENEDGTKDEFSNPYHLILENGGTLVDDLDGDIFEECCENLGLKVTRDNTYNHSGQSQDVEHIFDFDFAIIQNDDAKNPNAFLSVKFHCGGDIRGNYTSKVVYKFDSIDEIYSVIFPCKMLLNEEES
jgi:hypothetical protein